MLSLQIGSNRLDNLEETDEVYNISYSHTFGDTLSFGNIISKTCDVEIYNITESYSHLIGQQLIVIKDNKTKYKGYIYDCSNDGEKLTINASDKVNKLDNEWKVITGKITLKDLIIRTLKQQDITYSSASFNSFPNMNFVITESGELVNSTCRDVLKLCLELVGANGFINENEEFELLFFSNKNVKIINTDELLNFKRTTDKEIIVDNVKFFRGKFEFNNNSTRNNSINLTSNNLLVKYNSQEKVQSLLNNIKLNIKYTPCEIEMITNTEYKIGDYILTKYRNKNIYSYITSITSNEEGYYNILSCKIQDNEDVLSSTDGSNNSSYGSLNMYYTEKNFIQFNECNSSTKLTYSINFSAETDGFINILINGRVVRQFEYQVGHNSITSQLDYNFKDTTNIIKIDNLNLSNIDNYSFSIIYMNCVIYKDYKLEDIKIDNPSGSNPSGGGTITPPKFELQKVRGLIELKKNVRFAVKTNIFTSNNSRIGEKDLIFEAEKGKCYRINNETNAEVVFEGKKGMFIKYSIDDVKNLEKIIDKSISNDEYYILNCPYEMGTILTYKLPIGEEVGMDERINIFKIVKDTDKLTIPSKVLINIDENPTLWINGNDNGERVVWIDKYKPANLNDFTDDDEFKSLLVNDKEFYITQPYGSGGCVYIHRTDSENTRIRLTILGFYQQPLFDNYDFTTTDVYKEIGTYKYYSKVITESAYDWYAVGPLHKKNTDFMYKKGYNFYKYGTYILYNNDQ